MMKKNVHYLQQAKKKPSKIQSALLLVIPHKSDTSTIEAACVNNNPIINRFISKNLLFYESF